MKIKGKLSTGWFKLNKERGNTGNACIELSINDLIEQIRDSATHEEAKLLHDWLVSCETSHSKNNPRMDNELRERIMETIFQFRGADFRLKEARERIADEMLSLFPPRLSEEEIDNIIKQYLMNWIKEDGLGMGIGTIRRKHLASALAGRIEKPILEEKGKYPCCDTSNNKGEPCPIHSPEPKQYEHTKIEGLRWSAGQGLLGSDEILRLCVNKLNKLIQSTEKLWEAIEKRRWLQ